MLYTSTLKSGTTAAAVTGELDRNGFNVKSEIDFELGAVIESGTGWTETTKS